MARGIDRLNQPRMTLGPKLWQIHWIFVLLLCLVAAIGLAMLYSAAGGRLDPWASRQAVRFGAGLVVMTAMALVDIRRWLRYAYLIYLFSLALLVAVEFTGSIGMGARRWIDLGLITIQPSEVMKLALVLALSVCLHFVYLSSIPRIYSDEGLQARILQDFVSGHMRVESITWTGFSAFHPYPLLFYLVTAPLFLILKSVLAARIVTAASGVLTTWLIFAIGRRMKDVRTGLWSALFFTMMPFERSEEHTSELQSH